jgi:hypothetical protein
MQLVFVFSINQVKRHSINDESEMLTCDLHNSS